MRIIAGGVPNDRDRRLSSQRAFGVTSALRRVLSDGNKTARAAADCRTRAYNVLVDTYEACRRAATFVSWYEGDVDAIVPSLFKKKRDRKRRSHDRRRLRST